jgi:type I restriction enzyme R subunit
MSISPTEKRFEEHIEAQLNSLGFTSTHFNSYDRGLCLIRDEVLNFIRNTQPESWGRLEEIHGLDVESKILTRISSEIAKRGVIDVLKNQVVDRSVYLNLCYFEPKSDLNPDHRKLYDANRFIVVRQLHYSSQNENSIDMVLFLNGLPILTMELKNQLTGHNIKHSENQYRNDRDPKEPLLGFKRCLVHFCVDNNKVSMTTRLAEKKTFFLPYNRDLINPPVEDGYRTEYLWKEILTPPSLLDIIENFVHLATEKEYFYNEKTRAIDTKTKDVLIFPRYHQLDLIRKFRRTLKTDGIGKNYLVQHTTGSGKSYSIGWLAHTLTSFYKAKGDTERLFDTVIVVTDRQVLDEQLGTLVRSLQRDQGIVHTTREGGSKDLKQYLEQGKDIVITTIQKFPFISKTISALGDRTFAVIIDEVHSSQSGELSKELKESLSKTEEDDSDEYDYEEMLRREILSRGKQPHISFFGFTGTPKPKTLELFGTKTSKGTFDPFHIYSMYQSIHEGFTLDVLQNYITYKRYFKVKQTDDGDIEIPTGRGKRELIRYVDAHKMTIQTKVQIILDHWIDKGSKEIQGRSRGMVVTQSRKHCVWFVQEINRQLKERGLTYQSLVGFSGEVSIDGEKYTESECNKAVGHEGNVPLGLKNPQYRLLVVANKFQTGFDEPLIQSMYVDKILGGVQCVQTLSRLNRTTSGKTQTFVLDFVNNPDDVQESFQQFYQSTILEGETDPNRLYDSKREIYEFNLYTNEDVNRFCKVFYDPKRNEGALHPTLDHVVDKFEKIEDVEVKEDFRSRIQSYIRMYGYLSQIINFTDIELEKTFVFLRFLNKKLPKRETDKFDLSDAIDLDSLRIQKIHEGVGELTPDDAIVTPPTFDPTGAVEPSVDLLSEIIEQVNTKYGINLTEDDQLNLSRLRQRLSENPDIHKYMNGNNTEDNKRNFFKQQFEGMMVDYINERFDFYKKMEANPEMKNHIFRLMYSNYNDQRPST